MQAHLFIHRGGHYSDALAFERGTGPSNVIVFPWRIPVTAALAMSERVTRRRRLGEHHFLERGTWRIGRSARLYVPI